MREVRQVSSASFAAENGEDCFQCVAQILGPLRQESLPLPGLEQGEDRQWPCDGSLLHRCQMRILYFGYREIAVVVGDALSVRIKLAQRLFRGSEYGPEMATLATSLVQARKRRILSDLISWTDPPYPESFSHRCSRHTGGVNAAEDTRTRSIRRAE